ncbi:hypothetical protein [Dictyobacter aurantiacus]|uniref:Nitroreductase domain-containing protein n=1 Tax=Dictyobacter aurantiacus TaxID=1936993 RepID=A0A401ZSD9_9CHLR|nr:hypothetical protein [Dictyobacter aurantiacus]GCE09722.1 hypothetical protein KDAU_70510 [Dictyobacter aurantiacus]
MEFSEVVRKRRMVRHFKSDPILATDIPSPSLKRGRKSGNEFLHFEKW